MPSQLLNVAQRTARFNDLLGQAGDEGPSAGVARRTFDPEFAKLGVKPHRNGGGAISSRPLAVDDGMIRQHFVTSDNLQGNKRRAELVMKRDCSSAVLPLRGEVRQRYLFGDLAARVGHH